MMPTEILIQMLIDILHSYTMFHYVPPHTSQRFLCHWTWQRYLPVLLLTEVDKDSVSLGDAVGVVGGMTWASQDAGTAKGVAWRAMTKSEANPDMILHTSTNKILIDSTNILQVLLPATVWLESVNAFEAHPNWKPFLQCSILETIFLTQWSELKVWLTLRTGQLLGAMSTLKQLDQVAAGIWDIWAVFSTTASARRLHQFFP